jgi:hypothetical protein
VQDILEDNVGAIGRESGNVEVQWNNIKEYDLVGKVEKRARNPWITQEMISKMDEEGNGRTSTLNKAGETTGG